MKDSEWNAYFTDCLVEAEEALASFESAVLHHGMRIYHRDLNGERDVTEHERKALQDRITEYQRILVNEK